MNAALSVVLRPIDEQRRTYEVHTAHGHLTDVLGPLFAAGIVAHGGLNMHLLRCCSWTSPVKGEALSACADCFASGWQLHVNDPVVRIAAVPAVAQVLREAGVDVEVLHDPYRYATEVADDAAGSFDLAVALVYFPGRAELTFASAGAAADVNDYLRDLGLMTSRAGAVLRLATEQTEDVVAVLMHGGSHVTYSHDASVSRNMPQQERLTNRGTQPTAVLSRADPPSARRQGDGFALVTTRFCDTWEALRALNDAGLLVDDSLNVDWVPCGCFCTTLDVNRPDPDCQRCDGLGSEIRVSDCLVVAPDGGAARGALRAAGFRVLKGNQADHVEPSFTESWRTALRGVSLAVRVHPKQGVATVQCEPRNRAAYGLVSAMLADVGVGWRQGEFGLTTTAADAPYVCSALLRVGCTVMLLDPTDPNPQSWLVPHTEDTA